MNLKRIECFDHIANTESSHPTDDVPWLILFHGFGADAHDLEGLKDFFQFKSTVNLRFPNGVFEVPIGPGWTGRAWWPLRLTSLPEDWSNYTPAEMQQLVPALLKMIQDLKVPWNKIILGGFSQGAMLATELYLQAPETPMGLVSLSGSLIRQSEWKNQLSKRKGCKVLLSHGQNDQVLPIKGSQKLMALFQENGLHCKWVTFSGGHEIPVKVIESINNYVNELTTQN